MYVAILLIQSIVIVMRVDILAIVVSVCVCIVIGHAHRLSILNRNVIDNKLYHTDIENDQRHASVRLDRASQFYIYHERRIIALLSVVVFLVISFAHEWIQESMQIYGEVQLLLMRGPPEACEYTHRGWFSPSIADRERECQHYIDEVNRLPIANPIKSLIQLITSLIVEPCLYVTTSIGTGLQTFVSQQSYVTQVLMFTSLVVVLVLTIQMCLFSMCNPDGLLGRCCLKRDYSRVREPDQSQLLIPFLLR